MTAFVAALMAGLMVELVAGSGSIIPLSAKEKQDVVDFHNRVRSQVNPPASDMDIMEWDEKAAQAAAEWALQCKYEHKVWPIDGVYTGQNYGYWELDRPVTELAKFWEVEKKDFEYGVKTGTSQGKLVAHYTQMVWNQSSRVGCAKARCPSQKEPYYYVCNYRPGGNYNRDKGTPYTKGKWATKCAKGVASGYSGHLCAIPCSVKLAYDRYKSCPQNAQFCSQMADTDCPRTCGLCAKETATRRDLGEAAAHAPGNEKVPVVGPGQETDDSAMNEVGNGLGGSGEVGKPDAAKPVLGPSLRR